jgi:hypothetical protein
MVLVFWPRQRLGWTSPKFSSTVTLPFPMSELFNRRPLLNSAIFAPAATPFGCRPV